MPKAIEIPQVVLVRELAELIGVSAIDLIKALAKNGVMASINESIDFQTAEIIADEFDVDVKLKTGQAISFKSKTGSQRSPIVAVMGHVDHGKTKLLDAIRQTDIVSTESGGITQHIGAYQIEEKKGQSITFLDTPGHEAFSKMRAHGASITDIVVLVVAATEGIKPQTIEAISHARSANVPIIVAINKIDLPEADSENVKRQLAQQSLLAKDWGGDIEIVEVSAKEKTNIDELLKTIHRIAAKLDLKADKDANPAGYVIETHIETGKGPTATIVVMQGTLKKGDYLVIARTWGKVRQMVDWHGFNLEIAEPSTPVKISGLKSLPEIGEYFEVVANDKICREKTSQNKIVASYKTLKQENEGLKTFPIIIKADMLGSIFAIIDHIKNLNAQDFQIKIVSSGLGVISESDINTAVATKAIIFCFKAPIEKNIFNLAKQNDVAIYQFDVVYQLFDKLTELIEGVLEEKITEKPTGKFQIIKAFFQTDAEAVVGGKILNGLIKANQYGKILRQEELLGKVKILSCQTGVQEVDQIEKTGEYGLKLAKINFSEKIKPDDYLEAYEITKLSQKVTKINSAQE